MDIRLVVVVLLFLVDLATSDSFNGKIFEVII